MHQLSRMGKRFKLKLSNVIPSFQFCRSKQSATPLPSVYKPSPINRKVFDIGYPNLPAPPPSTPEDNFFKRQISSKIVSIGYGCRSESPEAYMWKKEARLHVIAKSDENEETETLISSSYEFGRWSEKEKLNEETRPGNKKTRLRRYISMKKGKENVEILMEKSFAVVKKSEDPREDFKESMMEMIMEKEMFEIKELEQLLLCFLCLNSRHFHRHIVEAFSDVWEILFINDLTFK